MSEDLIYRLRTIAKAYPVELFPPLRLAERDSMSGLLDRASADMGRHFSPLFTEAADRIERLERENEYLRKQVKGLEEEIGEQDATPMPPYQDVEAYRARVAARHEHYSKLVYLPDHNGGEAAGSHKSAEPPPIPADCPDHERCDPNEASGSVPEICEEPK